MQWGRIKGVIKTVYENMPVGAPEPKMTSARALLIKLMKQYAWFAYRLTLL